MIENRIAKLFKNGASQAVRLPADFRFPGDQVYISRDPRTGDVLLSSRPGAWNWSAFFELARGIDDADDFMADRPMNGVPLERELFADQ